MEEYNNSVHYLAIIKLYKPKKYHFCQKKIASELLYLSVGSKQFTAFPIFVTGALLTGTYQNSK